MHKLRIRIEANDAANARGGLLHNAQSFPGAVPMIEHNKNFILINEYFPHIGKKLKLFWGCPEFVALMDDLQQNKRGEQRQGFPMDIARALNNLDSEHSLFFPKLTRKSDIWGL